MKKTCIILFSLFIYKFCFSQEQLKWWNPKDSKVPVISNQKWSNELEAIFHRLPLRAKKQVRKPLWELSKNTAGLAIRFKSNSHHIVVKYTVKGMISFPHMPATGVSGLDLYYKTSNGNWRRTFDTYHLDKNSEYQFIIDDISNKYDQYGREYKLLLPLYNEVEKMKIGIDKNAFFTPILPINEKPIVAYGTSICQGACATRPGMAWTAILERQLNIPIINIGFSGNGKLEDAIIDLLNEINAKLYILDCLPNLYPEKDNAYQLTINAVKKLKEKHPDTPIILTAHTGYVNGFTNKYNYNRYTKLNNALYKAFQTLREKGYTKLYLLTKKHIGLGMDSYVDNTHPNDYGMIQYANAYEKLIRKIFDHIAQKKITTKQNIQ